jgi:acyl-CoA synthetase (NDP forming)
VRDGYARIAKAVKAHGHLAVFLSRASEPLDDAWHELFRELDVPFLQEYERSLRAIAALLRQRARNPRRQRTVRPRAIATDARDLLRDFEIPFARTESASSPQEAVGAAERLGYPVVVKAWTAHKSDLGAIRLGLLDATAVRGAFGDVAARAPGAEIVVQAMERGIAEVLVGVARDEHLGPVLVCGVGGVFVEALGDVAMRVPPIDRDDALEMIGSLRGKALLHGARGRPPADVDALADVLVRVGDLAVAGADEIEELDLNPVLVRAQGDGVVALDVLLVRRRAVAASSTPPVASTTTP